MMDAVAQELLESEGVEALLADLEAMKVADLKSLWSRRWGRPPECRSVWMLRRIVAWRLQTECHGGFDHWTAQQLSRGSTPRRVSPPAGSVISREYQGKLHQVEVLERGFRYHDDVFANLSDVAKRITGTHWNGPRFFGLRRV
jgi:Protein of unknown function (DUF2924)